MSISSLNDYIISAKQQARITKTTARTAVAVTPTSIFDLAGSPGAGTLAGSSTTAGVVPASGVAGYPTINAFGATAKGYLSKVSFKNSVAGLIALYDRLFLAGAYAFNAAVSLTAQPSYAGRVSNLDYTGYEIWIECVTAFTGIPTIAITYTNQAGTAAKTTGAVSLGSALAVGQCFRMPLAAGDTGVQKIESVTATVATVGTFNVMVLRPLWENRVAAANDGGINDMLSTGLPEVFATSALYALVTPDSTSTGTPYVAAEFANN